MNSARYQSLALATLLLLLVGCSITHVKSDANKVISDRYGIISITLPEGWYDDTSNFIRDVELFEKSNHLPRDPGIRTLLMIKRSGGDIFCKFRIFRYLANERGYIWDAKKVAEEVSNIDNASLMKNGFSDYFDKGVPVTPFQTKARKIELEESALFQLPQHQHTGWQLVFSLWFGNTGSNPDKSLKVVVPLSKKGSFYLPQYFLIVNCGIHESGGLLQQRKKEIIEMLNTIVILDKTL